VFGTPAFMAPEQALGKTNEIDARSDLWAVGATAFVLLSGRLVHRGSTLEETLVLAATGTAPALASIAHHIPPAIADVIDRALAFDKTDRWASAEAMRDALLHASCVVWGCDAPEDLEDQDEEKTVPPLPMASQGDATPEARSEPETITSESTTSPALMLRRESRTQFERAPRPRPVVSVIALGIAIMLAVIYTEPVLFVRPKHPTRSALQPATANPRLPASARGVTTSSAWNALEPSAANVQAQPLAPSDDSSNRP